jgi:hypothetical protein
LLQNSANNGGFIKLCINLKQLIAFSQIQQHQKKINRSIWQGFTTKALRGTGKAGVFFYFAQAV